MIEEILDAGQVGAMRRALDHLHDRTSVPWNDVYIATTSGGRSYNGRLVARSGDDFILRAAEGTSPRLYVGDMRDLPSWAVTGDRIRLEAKRFTATQSVLDLTPSRRPCWIRLSKPRAHNKIEKACSSSDDLVRLWASSFRGLWSPDVSR
jgi:hypothetical protein